MKHFVFLGVSDYFFFLFLSPLSPYSVLDRPLPRSYCGAPRCHPPEMELLLGVFRAISVSVSGFIFSSMQFCAHYWMGKVFIFLEGSAAKVSFNDMQQHHVLKRCVHRNSPETSAISATHTAVWWRSCFSLARWASGGVNQKLEDLSQFGSLPLCLSNKMKLHFKKIQSKAGGPFCTQWTGQWLSWDCSQSSGNQIHSGFNKESACHTLCAALSAIRTILKPTI